MEGTGVAVTTYEYPDSQPMTCTYRVVAKKAALALCDKSDATSCSLIISNGRILDVPLQDDRPWNLGRFFAEMGGMQKLSCMVIGIHIPVRKQMSCSCINLSTSFYSQMLKVVRGMKTILRQSVSRYLYSIAYTPYK